ncbi:MAG: hypothetical protein JRJ43_09025 [Deltaproteobacteria bacterium]|nr:hypothetical protein [Deltaproteobacteria bacterium]MBW1719691.1 hypothetical protein [Deltaproteobacteria bacterium]MBW1933214.1 hypothetical protein [Deltaproteobacteria bacterium]MBW1938713.1 hypothetical protein [Deltaproteobacteria bacterium]MBW1965465.1 hypothetical protein [Deltaproteobacteria bacterium]
MISHVLRLTCVLALLLTSGCIDATTVVSVKKDGSGSVFDVVFIGKGLQQMFQQMSAAMGGEAAASQSANSLIDIKKYKAQAATMGEGVRFISAKELKKTDGTTGVGVVYAFEDIRKLKISSDPDIPGQAEGQTSKKSNPITFDFAMDHGSKLTINLPQSNNGKKPKSSEMPPVDMQERPSEQLAQMKQMFDGFRVRIMVKVDGEIVRTNASYVQIDTQSKKKQLVTLLDMNIGEIMKDEEVFKKLAAMGEIRDMETASEKLKGIPGLKIETARRVEIEFL